MVERRSFDVEAYKVGLDYQTFPGSHEPKFDRVIEILGPTEIDRSAKGREIPIIRRQQSAVLSFSTGWNDWQSEVVGFWNTDEETLAGWFPEREFPFWYEVLKTERPLQIFFVHRETMPPSGVGHYVTVIGLGSSSELVGEGPKDAS